MNGDNKNQELRVCPLQQVRKEMLLLSYLKRTYAQSNLTHSTLTQAPHTRVTAVASGALLKNHASTGLQPNPNPNRDRPLSFTRLIFSCNRVRQRQSYP